MKKKALSLILSAAMALSLTIVPVSAVSVSNFQRRLERQLVL